MNAMAATLSISVAAIQRSPGRSREINRKANCIHKKYNLQ